MQNIEELEEQKRQIESSSINDRMKKIMIKNIDWSILAVLLSDTENDRKKYRDMVSQAIHQCRPDDIKYISTDEVENEINNYMEMYYNNGYKIVYIVESGIEDINDIVLFYCN